MRRGRDVSAVSERTRSQLLPVLFTPTLTRVMCLCAHTGDLWALWARGCPKPRLLLNGAFDWFAVRVQAIS